MNRNIRSIVLIAGFAPLTNRSLGWLADASPTHVLAVDLLFFGCCAAIGSVILKARWLWVGATGFLLSAFLIALRPASAEWVFTFVPLIAVSLAAGGWLWQRRSQAR